MLPRGQGKTSLTAVLALFELLAGAEGAQVVVVAPDERQVYEVVTLATGKQQSSVVLAMGTPGPELEQTVLGRLRTYALDHPDDPLVCGGSTRRPGLRITPWTAAIAGSWPTRRVVTFSPGMGWRRACRRR